MANQNRNGAYPPHKMNCRRMAYRFIDESSAEFFVHPFSLYDSNRFPNFKQPVELGSFISEKRQKEIEEKRQKMEDSVHSSKLNGLRFYVHKEADEINFDLNLGFSKYIPHIPHQSGIDTLLKWIVENKHKLLVPFSTSSSSSGNKNKLFTTDFVCWRGLLTTLLTTPYEKKSDFLFGIIFYKGTYYLCEYETERDVFERLNMDEKTKLFSYHGHKFESYVTADLPDEKPTLDHDESPDPESNYASVIVTRLNQKGLVYGAEIDCCMLDTHSTLGDYCELKTSFGKSIDDLNFEKNIKFLKWWLQSFLVGTETIKVGLKNEQGIVSKIVDCQVREIYEKSRNSRWNKSLCFNFLNSLLDFIQMFCKEEKCLYLARRDQNAEQVKIFKYNAPQKPQNQTEQDSNEYQKQMEEYERFYFLREWFTAAV